MKIQDAIDRRAVVARHRIRHTEIDAEAPLSVGNGEFCFTADATGLQTFADWHSRAAARADGRSATPLGTQSQWAFHWAPNPADVTLEDTMEQFERPDGTTVAHPTAYDWRLTEAEARELQPAGYYYWVNPQRLHLGRLAFRITDPKSGQIVGDPAQLSDTEQTLDLWTGLLDSAFSVGGLRTTSRTAVHPTRDLLAVSVTSELFAAHAATIRLSFATIQDTWEADEDWTRPDAHETAVTVLPDGTVEVFRRVDDAEYWVHLHATGCRVEASEPHVVELIPESDRIELVVEFTHSKPDAPLPATQEAFDATAAHWESYWTNGAFVDLSGSSDPRAHELERRIILSQYLTAIQCAGSLPPQESGLVCNSWGGTFHLEMHWWHAAHFALWGRPALLERSLAWYRDILPAARANAARLGYPGARWPKHVGPEGVESPNEIGPLLIWQQSHPISYAELVYRASGDDEQVLTDYAELVDETAEFLAGVLWWDDGIAHLAPPLMPAQERYDAATTWDPTFELAYIWWALATASEWRRRRGLDVPPHWQRALDAIAPLPRSEDRYAAVRGETALVDHPSLLGAFGFVPPTPLVDTATMSRTLDMVLDEWDWNATWGWDYPLIAMCATRLGRLDTAIETLLRRLPRNRYLTNGHNFQVPNRLPLYLPGNGGLLAAVAMLASDDDGRPREGLPVGWRIRADGFPARPRGIEAEDRA
ncbi:hypothetical protein [Microbacterium sp.]|uniref:hypothetical protein n=1 Tax=Microbacterium sp. TaxID=51671 RepID=UPI00273240C7|nr:hypothetical protein [Microbacterium sp.]MDP3949453.1 hypothetical protein [Microbacterium sp.]